MWFKLQQKHLDFVDKASFSLKNEISIAASPEQVFDLQKNKKKNQQIRSSHLFQEKPFRYAKKEGVMIHALFNVYLFNFFKAGHNFVFEF